MYAMVCKKRKERIMKKLFTKGAAVLLTSFLVLGGLTACGGKDPGAESETTSAASAETTKAGDTASTFTYAIAGDPGANVNVITTVTALA